MIADEGYSRRLDAAWNVAFGYANIFMSLVRNILMVPLYLSFISISEYGAWLATGSALINIIVTDFGLAGATLQRVSYLLGGNDKKVLGDAVGTSILSGLILSMVLSCISFLLAPFIPQILDLDENASTLIYNCFLLAILANAVAVLGVVALGVLKSLRSPILAGVINVASDAVSIGVTVVLMFNEFGLYAIAIGLVVRAFILMISGTIFAILTSIKQFDVYPNISISEANILFRNTGYLFISSIAMKIQTQADTFFVGAFVSPASAGIYGLTMRAYETVHMIANQINRGVAPSLANLYGSGDELRYKEVVYRFALLLIFIGSIGMGCYAILNESFVQLWVGEEFYLGDISTYLLAIGGLVLLVGSVGYDVLSSSAEFKFLSRVFLMGSIIHAVLIYFILQVFGIELAPLARLITCLIWGCVFWSVIYSKYSLSSHAINRLLVSFVAHIMFTIAVVISIVNFIDMQIVNWWQFVVYSVVIVFMLMLVNLLINREARNMVFQEVKGILNKS